MQQGTYNVAHDLRYFLHKHRRMSILISLLLIAFTVIPSTIYAISNISSDNEPGTHGNRTRLINNWVITPAGKQTILGDLPLNSVLSPDGHFLLVANGGAGIQSLQVVRTSDSRILQTIPYTVPHSVFVGLTYSPDGRHAYASGGGEDVVHSYDVISSGLLAPTGDIVIGTTTQNPFPTGLSISPDGSTLYVANNLTNNVSIVSIATKTVTGTVAIGSDPYTTLVSHDGKTVYTSNWGDGTISVIDVASKAVTATIQVGSHPTAMTLGAGSILYVTDANSDAVSVVDTAAGKETGRISVSLYKDAPLSSSPGGMAISSDHKYLYVSNAGNNDVAVVALSGDNGLGSVIGKIPTAWYPISVQLSPDNSTLYVTNGKGRGAGPNDKPIYPNPTRKHPPIIDGITGYNDGYCNCTFDQGSAYPNLLFVR